MDAPVDVIAASDGERHLTCSAASHALQLLGRCGISLRRPLRVEIMSEVRHPFTGVILGLLDTKQERVLVTREANVPSLLNGTPAGELPLREFYRSLIVHEVVHGVMHQNMKRRLWSHAEAEYPAYALQIESLPPDMRDRFLQSFDDAATKAGTLLFNDIVLSLDPFFFATSAYRPLHCHSSRRVVTVAPERNGARVGTLARKGRVALVKTGCALPVRRTARATPQKTPS